MKGIMIQGTASDVGKSYVTTAICRILSNKGLKIAPFKSQNMSNNSYVTHDGKEIGRAQGVQAEAARAIPEVFMNPILLKPQKDTQSEVVLMGEVYKNMTGKKYNKEFTLKKGLETVKKCLTIIDDNYDAIVIEGAGSPSEVNLNDREIVNMRIAEAADVPVILVADIDRGGSFGSIVGTLELVFEHRHRIKAIIFNKFRGDISLLEPGLKWIEEYTKVPVLGVIPYLSDVYIEVEDAQSDFLKHHFDSNEPLDIAVIHMERVSNNTDVETFIHENDVSIRIIKNASDFGNPDAIIIPGTKSTIADLNTLKEKGLDKKIIEFSKKGKHIFGICGGLQVLGQTIKDPNNIDNQNTNEIEGLSLIPIQTTFLENKEVRKVTGKINKLNLNIEGYEIHLGKTKYLKDNINYFSILNDETKDGYISEDFKIAGTYLHNVFHNDEFRNKWLNKIRKQKNNQLKDIVDTTKIKEESYNKLAEVVEENIDMDLLMKLVNE